MCTIRGAIHCRKNGSSMYNSFELCTARKSSPIWTRPPLQCTLSSGNQYVLTTNSHSLESARRTEFSSIIRRERSFIVMGRQMIDRSRAPSTRTGMRGCSFVSFETSPIGYFEIHSMNPPSRYSRRSHWHGLEEIRIRWIHTARER